MHTTDERSDRNDILPQLPAAAVCPNTHEDTDLQRVHRFLAESGLEPRDQLPPERELSDTLGLSRARLRGILRKLAAEGVIWRRVGKGTFLGLPPTGGRLIEAGPPLVDMANPREIMEARLALEPQLARLAAMRATRHDFEEMDLCVEQLRTVPTGPVWEMWDIRLHRAVAKSTENKIMLGMFDLMYSKWNKDVWGDLRAIYHTAERIAEGDMEHTEFVSAIKARKPGRCIQYHAAASTLGAEDHFPRGAVTAKRRVRKDCRRRAFER